MRGFVAVALGAAATLSGVVALYLAAALLASQIFVPTSRDFAEDPGQQRTIVLLGSPLHVDIALPADPLTIATFPQLIGSTVPVDNPNLRYIGVGWGSKAFYTTAGTYEDITLSATVRAVFGDDAVLRFTGLGDVAGLPQTRSLALGPLAYEALLRFIQGSFATSSTQLSGTSIGPNDAFFPAKGDFDVLYPCNEWVADALKAAGVPMGVWTPTTYAVFASLDTSRGGLR